MATPSVLAVAVEDWPRLEGILSKADCLHVLVRAHSAVVH